VTVFAPAAIGRCAERVFIISRPSAISALATIAIDR